MNKEIVRNIIDSVENYEYELGDFLKFSDEGYVPLRIDKKNFCIAPTRTSNRKMIFVDGGITEILGAPNFSLSLIRIYYTIYQNNKRIKADRSEFFALVKSFVEKEIKYQTKIFSKEPLIDELVFNSMDPSLRQGNQRASISSMANIIRRFCEIKSAELLAANEDSLIVLDGNLQATYPKEDVFLKALYEKALQNNTIVSALPKTCSLLTDKGNSITHVLAKLCPEKWDYYHPIAEIDNKYHKAELFFLKLHEKSKHIFRYDIFKENKFDIDEIASLLKENSKDPLFPGYPYGLIEADRFARISTKEAEGLRLEFKSRCGLDWRRIQSSLSSQNAHDILNGNIF